MLCGVRGAEAGVIQEANQEQPRAGTEHRMPGGGQEHSTVSLQGSVALPTH